MATEDRHASYRQGLAFLGSTRTCSIVTSRVTLPKLEFNLISPENTFLKMCVIISKQNWWKISNAMVKTIQEKKFLLPVLKNTHDRAPVRTRVHLDFEPKIPLDIYSPSFPKSQAPVISPVLVHRCSDIHLPNYAASDLPPSWWLHCKLPLEWSHMTCTSYIKQCRKTKSAIGKLIMPTRTTTCKRFTTRTLLVTKLPFGLLPMSHGEGKWLVSSRALWINPTNLYRLGGFPLAC